MHESFWSLYWRDLCDYWPRIGDHASARRMRAQPEWASWQCSAYAEWIYSIGVRGEINIALAPHAGRPCPIGYRRPSSGLRAVPGTGIVCSRRRDCPAGAAC